MQGRGGFVEMVVWLRFSENAELSFYRIEKSFSVVMLPPKLTKLSTDGYFTLERRTIFLLKHILELFGKTIGFLAKVYEIYNIITL